MLKLKDLLPECNECGRDWNHGHDHEAPMAHGELKDAISNASKIQNMIGDNDNLPGWVSSYITLASDYLHSVAEYMAGQSEEMPQEPGPGFSLNESSAERIKAQDIKKGDILGSGEQITSVSKTPAGKIEFTSTKDGKTRTATYGADAMVTRLKKGVAEAKKPSAGLTKKEKSTVAKKAASGKDIGKRGKGFEKIAKAAEKKYGSKEAGEKVAAAAMWKNIKR